MKMKTLHEKLRKMCEPNPKMFPDPFNHQFIWNRNMMNLYVCISINILFLISLPTSPYSLSMNLFNLLANFLMLSLFLVLCRSYLWVFHLFHTIFVSIAGFPLLDAIPDAGYFYMGYAFTLPPFILILSGNVKLASFAGAVQFYLSMTKFKARFTEMVQVEDPVMFADKFVTANTYLFMIGLFGSLFLLRTLDQRTLELLKAQKTTEMALEQQKTFIFSFSHELRNPINSLLGNLQLVLQGETLSPKARDMISVAKVCGDILLHGINNVLDTGKHDIGKLEVNAVPTRLHELFQRTWGIYSELLRQKKLRGQLKIEKSTPPMVKIDSHKVNQILLNLIGNSIKFTEKGSVTVTIKWLKCEEVNEKCFQPVPYDDVDEGIFEKEDNLSTVYSGKFETEGSFLVLNETKRQFSYDEVVSPDEEVNGILKIIVKDTGSGMKKEALGRLFQKFSQVSENISQRQIGTGLGLFITKEICKAMNGDIRAYSRLGTGTTFIVCLPASAMPLNQMLRTHSSIIMDRLSERRLKALVADDSPFNVSLTCNYLSKFGASVVSVAYNGYDAFMKYRESKRAKMEIDVVTLDIDMPIMDGRTVCDKIRQYEKDHNLPAVVIILISGNYDKEQINEYINPERGHRADCFLKKPVCFEDFSQTVYHYVIKRNC